MAKAKKLKGGMKKDWYKLIAPKIFNNRELGETPVVYPDQAKERSLEVALNELNPTAPKFYFKIFFKADSVEDKKINLKFTGHECSRDFIFRMVRKGLKRVDTRATTKTKDGKVIIMKSIATTIRRVPTSVKGSVRAKISEEMEKYASNNNLDDIIQSMITGEMQKDIKKKVSKVYPLRELEMRKSEVR